MFTEQLKEHTQTAHTDLEKLIIVHLRSMRTKKDYLDLLNLFYGYFNSLEQAVDDAIDLTLLPDYPDRRKSSFILNDIRSLKGATANLPQSDDIPAIETHAQAMGALYVMEGSTLGGIAIKKIISDRLGMSDTGSLSFFNGYGEHTFRMWEIFKMALNNEGQTGEFNRECIIRTATDTFKKFKTWIQKHEH